MYDTYTRVLPRDLFNESMLLKCLGKLTMLIEDELIPGLSYEHDTDVFKGFLVDHNEADFYTYAGNLEFLTLTGRGVRAFIRINERGSWPLILTVGDEHEYYPFNEEGEYQLAKDLFINEPWNSEDDE